MNTTTETRTFDIKMARLGAPYATRGGDKATILKWDCNHPIYMLVGVCGHFDKPMRWKENGRFGNSAGTFVEDLVMTPLGYIDGKPFFCGDIIIGATGHQFIAEPRDQDGDHASWRLPAKDIAGVPQ